MKIPYLMHADALKLKRYAETELAAVYHNHERVSMPVSCYALISLIEQAHSPQLGMATSKELREEIAARGIGSPDDYKTFQPDDAAGESHA